MIQRKPLRTDVQREILDRIVDGRLAAGARINETHLSAEVGVSRTPLREAMLGLEAAGFLASSPGRGFVVPQLDTDEFLQIQRVLTHLSPLALQLSPAPAPQRIMELQNLLGRLRTSAAPDALASLALRWSGLLVGSCPNQVLTGDLARLETLAVRYWREAALRGWDFGPVLASYGEIYEELRTDRGDEAGRLWSDHIERFSAAAAMSLPRAAARG